MWWGWGAARASGEITSHGPAPARAAQHSATASARRIPAPHTHPTPRRPDSRPGRRYPPPDSNREPPAFEAGRSAIGAGGHMRLSCRFSPPRSSCRRPSGGCSPRPISFDGQGSWRLPVPVAHPSGWRLRPGTSARRGSAPDHDDTLVTIEFSSYSEVTGPMSETVCPGTGSNRPLPISRRQATKARVGGARNQQAQGQDQGQVNCTSSPNRKDSQK